MSSHELTIRYILTTLTVLLTIPILFISVSLISQTFKQHTVSKIVLIGHTLLALVFAVTSISFCIKLIWRSANPDLNPENARFGLWITRVAFNAYNISHALMIIIFTMRIQITFKNRAKTMQVSKWIIISLYISAPFVFIFFKVIRLTWDSVSNELRIILIAINATIFCILCLVIMSIFNRQIKRFLVLSSRDNMDPDILYIITKQSLLVSITVIVTYFGYCMDITTLLFLNEVYGVSFYVFNCTVSSLCLYLLFRFSDKWYKRLCNKAHGTCEKYTNKQMVYSGSIDIVHHGTQI